ncbi:unnamed protein product [Parajaminaea phylloscopi]
MATDTPHDAFALGRNICYPLVTAHNLQAHVKLLYVFDCLKDHVKARAAKSRMPPPYSATPDLEPPPPAILSGDLAWSAFLHRALDRFEAYATEVLQSHLASSFSPFEPSDLARVSFGTWPLARDQYGPFMSRRAIPVPSDRLPPLDVALIWHAYLLNPSRYHEDVVLQPHRLALHRCAFPLSQLMARVTLDESGYPSLVTHRAAALWQDTFDTPFDPLETMPWERESSVASFRCPSCSHDVPVRWVEVATGDKWSRQCPRRDCGQTVSAATLRGHTFATELERWAQTCQDPEGHRLRGGIISAADGRFFHIDPYGPLISSMFTGERKPGSKRRDWRRPETTNLRGFEVPSISALEAFLAAHRGSTIDDYARDFAGIALRNIQGSEKERGDALVRIDYLLRFYLEANPVSIASVDLVLAVCRQEKFISELRSVPAFSSLVDMTHFAAANRPVIRDATIRYHRWLRLFFLYPDRFLAPTLDIDLAWHTHQLDPEYYTQCFSTVGRFIDHDDRVLERDLGHAFERTRELWSATYSSNFSRFAVAGARDVDDGGGGGEGRGDNGDTAGPCHSGWACRLRLLKASRARHEPPIAIRCDSNSGERTADGPSTHTAVRVCHDASRSPVRYTRPHYSQRDGGLCGYGLPPRHHKTGMPLSVRGVEMRRHHDSSLQAELGLVEDVLVPVETAENRHWSQWRRYLNMASIAMP